MRPSRRSAERTKPFAVFSSVSRRGRPRASGTQFDSRTKSRSALTNRRQASSKRESSTKSPGALTRASRKRPDAGSGVAGARRTGGAGRRRGAAAIARPWRGNACRRCASIRKAGSQLTRPRQALELGKDQRGGAHQVAALALGLPPGGRKGPASGDQVIVLAADHVDTAASAKGIASRGEG